MADLYRQLRKSSGLKVIVSFVILITVLFWGYHYIGSTSKAKREIKNMNGDNHSGHLHLEIISPVFRNGNAIPAQYTCQGQNVNPPINFFNVPVGTQSLTLIMHDPDAPSGDYLHWLIWDIPPKTDSIAVNSVPVGALQGANGSGDSIYMGPCPPAGSGTHRYIFDLYALDKSLNLPGGSSLEAVIKAQADHVLDHSRLTGTFSAAS